MPTNDQLIREAYNPPRHKANDRIELGVMRNELLERARFLAHSVEGRLAKDRTQDVGLFCGDISDMIRAADHLQRKLDQIRPRTRTAPMRAGVLGRAWMCEYETGWSVFVRDHGLVAENLPGPVAAIGVNLILAFTPHPERIAV